MKSFEKIRNVRCVDKSGMLSIGLLVLAVLILFAGCGKPYINISLDRPDRHNQPTWVGVYFLSQESALDDMDNDLLTNPDGVNLGNGVVQKEVLPIYPGEQAHEFELKDYDQDIRWVVVAAGFPDAQRCARGKVPVKEGAKLKISVTVEDKCIFLVWAD